MDRDAYANANSSIFTNAITRFRANFSSKLLIQLILTPQNKPKYYKKKTFFLLSL